MIIFFDCKETTVHNQRLFVVVAVNRGRFQFVRFVSAFRCFILETQHLSHSDVVFFDTKQTPIPNIYRAVNARCGRLLDDDLGVLFRIGPNKTL